MLCLICIEFLCVYFLVLYLYLVKLVSVCLFFCTALFVSISQVIGCEDRLRNDLYCVGWGVKLCSLTYLQFCLFRGQVPPFPRLRATMAKEDVKSFSTSREDTQVSTNGE